MFVCFNVFLLDNHVCLFPTGRCIRVCKKVGGGASWRNIFNIDWDCQSCIDQLPRCFFIYKLAAIGHTCPPPRTLLEKDELGESIIFFIIHHLIGWWFYPLSCCSVSFWKQNAHLVCMVQDLWFDRTEWCCVCWLKCWRRKSGINCDEGEHLWGTFCQKVSDLGIKHRHYNSTNQARNQRTWTHLGDQDVQNCSTFSCLNSLPPIRGLSVCQWEGKLTFGQKPFYLLSSSSAPFQPFPPFQLNLQHLPLFLRQPSWPHHSSPPRPRLVDCPTQLIYICFFYVS